jgi:hypothetical protein
MAEEVLVGEDLTSEMIKAGEELVATLDRLNVIVKGAFWLLNAEQRVWRLFVVSPEVRTAGPKAMYRRIRSALGRIPSDSGALSTKDISVIDDRAPQYVLLRSAVSTGPGISGIRFSRNVVNGHLIEDAYLYRLA